METVTQIVTQKDYLKLAIPFTLSTVTQPLLGAVDTAVVGRLDSPAVIGGVAIGTVIFNTLYWLLGFLRVATSGFAAQTLGQNRPDDLAFAWLRPLIIAGGMGVLFVLCRSLIINSAMALYNADPDVAFQAVNYFDILIWGAPFVLIAYVNLGWLMGRGHVRDVLILQVGTNTLNIILDLLFVLVLHLGVEGVATATLISQAAGFFAGLGFIFKRRPLSQIKTHLHGIFEGRAMKRLATVNTDLFIRTACLLTMTNIFVAKGSSMGADILAANAILFQIQYLLAYLFDGLANAVSVFAGKYVGSGDLQGFLKTRNLAHGNLAGLGIILIGTLLLFSKPLLMIFTDLGPILDICFGYSFYLILFILAMGPGLVYAGFYIGATCSVPIRNSLAAALVFFVLLEMLLMPSFKNHGLWIAFIVFCAVRSLVLYFYWDRMINQAFKQTAVRPC